MWEHLIVHRKFHYVDEQDIEEGIILGFIDLVVDVLKFGEDVIGFF